MKQELSILIPTFNHPCLILVQDLLAQINDIGLQSYEIIVIEDGSTDMHSLQINASIEHLNHCKYIPNKHNIGRAAVRNELARMAQYAWLLFIDADMKIVSPHYLSLLLQTDERHSVVYGGNSVHNDSEKPEYSLRYRYEKAGEKKSNELFASNKDRGNKNIHTSNLLIRKEVMLNIPFNEIITKYGYEDILLGRDLLKHNIHVYYIHNPVGFTHYDENELFLRKTEESLHTLYHLKDHLQGFTAILSAATTLEKWHLCPLAKWFYKAFCKKMQQHLTGNSPSLTVFSLYKLGYYISITDNKKER